MLKVGLIGCGFMGTMHANCYKNIPGVVLAAVADLSSEKANAVAAGTDAVIYTEGKDLIAHAQVDIIDICLPTYLHGEYALLAMEKVQYLFIEKPVTLTVQEADTLLAKSKETGCRVQVGQVIRFWDEYMVLRDIIQDQRYGKVVNANFRRLSPSPDWGWNNWLHDVTLSGGAAQDLHIHDVDYVLSVFGEPKSLSSVRNTLGEENSYINTLMQFDGFAVGVEGTWNLPASHPFQASFRVVFENAVVENDAGCFILYTAEGACPIEITKLQLTAQGGTQGNISDLGGYYNELVYFTKQASASGPIEQASLEAAAASLRFLLQKELTANA